MLQKSTFGLILYLFKIMNENQNENLGTLQGNIVSVETRILKETGFGNKWPDDATLVHQPKMVNIYTLFRPNIYI